MEVEIRDRRDIRGNKNEQKNGEKDDMYKLRTEEKRERRRKIELVSML
jgi:hypothetical protein